ncbi:putative glycoside hydrolase family 18, catalytic domain, glycosyl hydrolase family 18 (GH18) active [Septoria linicola]|nr:putative glycoside hydrolase family 18, catalytic domain, glycosyl hydrolase family 18 (GH18) active [Septoria linicola]
MASYASSPRKGGVLSSLITATLLLSTFTSAAVQLKGHPLKHHHPHAAVDLGKRVDMQPVKSSEPGHVTHAGFKTVGYYVSWAIYGRDWPPQNIQSEQLTHLLYAFAGIDNKTGEASLTDPFADIQKKFPTDDASDNSTSNLYGNLKQIYLHKKKNRNLKTLLSIGGWNVRTYFAPALATPQGRKTFARTSVQLLKDHGFDGLDIDWEYPNNTKQAQDLVDTCKEFRAELDNYSRNLTGNPHFLLTLAVPAGPDHFPYFDMQGLAPYVDFVNLMGYDYAGTFSDFSGHSANVYKSESNPLSTNFSTQDAMDYYLGESGWDKQKLTLGMPLYGRSFANTSGPGETFSNETGGSWENGAWDYKALAGNASFGKIHHDNDIIASWSYNDTNGYMVSYDTPEIATKKSEYIKSLGLSGAMWWELSGDTPINSTSSLIRTVTDYFETCGGMEQCQNVLDYPHSKYKNLRQGMPNE